MGVSRVKALLSPVQSFGRAFWIISTLGALVTIATILALYEWQGRKILADDEARATQHVARTFGNLAWSKHGDFLRDADKLSTLELARHPQQAALLDALRQTAAATGVLQLKIHSAVDGRTLFSSDRQQLGHPAREPAFTQAMRGASTPTFDNKARLESLSGPVQGRDVFSMHVPFLPAGLTPAQGKPAFMVWVASDVTERLSVHARGRWVLVAGVAATLSMMFATISLFGRIAAQRLAKAEEDKRRQAERLRQQAFLDGLTGLPNRARFTELGNKMRTDKRARPYGVMFIDLDRFKLVNDSMGSKVGDGVLRQAAQRIRKSLRDVDRVFRVGGDEFVAIVSTDDLPALDIAARRIVGAMTKRFVVDEADVSLSVSIGIARGLHDADSLDQVTACAELAMVAAKRAGANQHAMYRAEMKRDLDDEISMLAGLRSALQRNEFLIHYQPRLNSISGAIESVEALLRWHHPTLGILPPGRFIDILEDNPLIIDVGAWVIDAAASQLAEWHRQGHKQLRVSVNVAARQFRHKGLVKTVHRVLRDSGIPSNALELEITEGQLVHDADGAMQTLDRLKALGVSLSIDDFGTGYSSLAYLQKLPIDCIKIDRAFVKDLGADVRQGNIARAIANMAHGLGLKVVAEGVESEVQAKLLRAWGCEQLQGFLFSKPVPARDIDNLLRVQRMDEENAAAEVKALIDAATEYGTFAAV